MKPYNYEQINDYYWIELLKWGRIDTYGILLVTWNEIIVVR